MGKTNGLYKAKSYLLRQYDILKQNGSEPEVIVLDIHNAFNQTQWPYIKKALECQGIAERDI